LLEFNDDLVFKNINKQQQGGEFIAYNYEDARQIEALYEELLSEKNKVITFLEDELKKHKK
jgi:hypothetical protein